MAFAGFYHIVVGQRRFSWLCKQVQDTAKYAMQVGNVVRNKAIYNVSAGPRKKKVSNILCRLSSAAT